MGIMDYTIFGDKGIMGSKTEGGTSVDPNAYKSGISQGKERGEQMYGMTDEETQAGVQDISKRRKDALDGNDPATTAMRNSSNAKLRAAKASGATQDQVSQMERAQSMDISQQEYKSQNEALGEYQSLMANILGGKTSLEFGYGSLANASQQATPGTQKSNVGGTVICTELHRQGYLSSEILEKDEEYGRLTRLNDVAVYVGYIWLARPIVGLMRKSDMFTSLVSIPALSWAHNMANGKVGIIEKIGKPLCRFVGKILISLYDKELIYA